jgi:hypothetical protein
MSYFQTKFSGAPIPQTDHRQTRSMLAQFKEQTAAKKEKAKGLSEDQKRLEMVAMGLDPNIDKGVVQSMSRGELKGHIEKILAQGQRRKDEQAQRNKDREYKLAGDAQQSLDDHRGSTETHNKNLFKHTKQAEKRARKEKRRPSDFTKLVRQADTQGGGGAMNDLMNVVGMEGVEGARSYTNAKPKASPDDFLKFQENQLSLSESQRKSELPRPPAGQNEPVTDNSGNVIGHLVHTGGPIPTLVHASTKTNPKVMEERRAEALQKAFDEDNQLTFIAVANSMMTDAGYKDVYPPRVLEMAEQKGWKLVAPNAAPTSNQFSTQ